MLTMIILYFSLRIFFINDLSIIYERIHCHLLEVYNIFMTPLVNGVGGLHIMVFYHYFSSKSVLKVMLMDRF